METLRLIFFSGFAGLVLLTVWSGNAEGRGPEENTRVPGTPQTFEISQTDNNVTIKDQFENYAIRWFKNQSREKTKGVALVIHGLNLRPDKMQTIISVLVGSGIDVLRLSLRGHGDNYKRQPDIDEEQARLETFKAVSFPLWLNEAYLAYNQARKRAAQKRSLCFLLVFPSEV